MSFTFLFYKQIMFRKSCGKCHFTNTKRPSDITIADFWGWEKTDANFNADDKGCSLVLINSEKGQKLFEAIRERMNVIPAKLENCIQPNMQHPSFMDSRRDQFEKQYVKRGFEYVYFKYGEDGWRYKWHKFFRKIHVWLGAWKNNIIKRIR